MPAKIEIEKFDASRFRVRVIEAGSESTHQVTLDPKDRARLAGEAVEPETLIRKSFEFLLEREPKESILSRFDLSVISRYFPEYESEIKRGCPQACRMNAKAVFRLYGNVVIRDGVALAADGLDAQDFETSVVQVLHIFLHRFVKIVFELRAFESESPAAAHRRDRSRFGRAPWPAIRQGPTRAAARQKAGRCSE